MAGHSKWSNIKHRKGRQDKKRAKKFARLSKEITVAVREGGGDDPEFNARLRQAIQNAKAEDMPKDNIQRAIENGLPGSETGKHYDEIRYEGYGPGGTAFIIDAMTDNRNRTASEVRAAFTKHGGNLGEDGSVSYLFDRIGQIVYEADEIDDQDDLFMTAVDAGADNVIFGEDQHEVITQAEDFGRVWETLEDQFGEAEKAELAWRAKTPLGIKGEELEKVANLYGALDDLDDVQKVSLNITRTLDELEAILDSED
jgi:YebC/PmpR family DNA-binding regulatory protein